MMPAALRPVPVDHFQLQPHRLGGQHALGTKCGNTASTRRPFDIQNVALLDQRRKLSGLNSPHFYLIGSDGKDWSISRPAQFGNVFRFTIPQPMPAATAALATWIISVPTGSTMMASGRCALFWIILTNCWVWLTASLSA